MTAGDADAGWHHLHPLSPVVRLGRGLVPLVVLGALSSVRGGHAGGPQDLIWIALAGLGVVVGVIHWLVTRWAFDGATLRIETGLVRRDSQQLPVARIQAVDVVQPFGARVLGLAELRIRVAGAKSAHHLSYLAEPAATDLRARLLATHHGLDQSVPAPDEHPVEVVPTGRLLGSVLLSATTMGALVFVVALAVLSAVSATAAAAVAGSLFVYLIGFGQGIWRRCNEQYGFTVAMAPDGIRVRRGLLSTVAETIPVRRVQAVRQIEPLLWRAFGWCRLEVDLAGVPGHDRSGGGGRGRVTKALLPVGPRESATTLRRVVIGAVEPAVAGAPRGARLKAPLSYHFLAAGHDRTMAVAVTGRVQKVTCWVPLEKAQSVRRVQGPVQRALHLATVHVDVAGKRAGASFRDRAVDEVDHLVEELASLSRGARRRLSVGPEPGTPGWFADPARRHQVRYWDSARWTDHVADDGVGAVDPL
ncbi:MAG TPA: PH domain-containing protein [Acidimicrobiales bacterium]|nr:PH domain-containing protein [Acidimicrobiales bacterium]